MMIKILDINERISYLIENQYNSNQKKFAESIGYSAQVVFNIVSGRKTKPSFDVLNSIISTNDDINSEWLLTGKGSMLKMDQPESNESKNLIPFYEDVQSIGGNNLVAETGAVYNSNILIDAGDWFKGATAAIRHYNDSMVEYPSGCILALRELKDKTEIEWGRNYVVETPEMRVTKKLAELDQNYIMGYSTNKETYFDGTLIHQPIKIRKKSILKIARVLGSVNKEESTGMVQLM